jgi:hypothetical protein
MVHSRYDQGTFIVRSWYTLDRSRYVQSTLMVHSRYDQGTFKVRSWYTVDTIKVRSQYAHGTLSIRSSYAKGERTVRPQYAYIHTKHSLPVCNCTSPHLNVTSVWALLLNCLWLAVDWNVTVTVPVVELGKPQGKRKLGKLHSRCSWCAALIFR